MIVDVRGYQPSEIKVNVFTYGIEIAAIHEQVVKGSAGTGYANRTTTKIYELPSSIICEQVIGNLSPDGTLFISAPWNQRTS